jgi:membrane protein required for colicin V production
MNIHYFDIIVGVIVLLLGLKGILNGFFKELFGLIGIIGGIFVASRFSQETGSLISNAIFHFESESAIKLTGFLLTLAVFWATMIGLGILFKKLSKVSGLGPVDKLMGFIVGSGKFFLIAAVIVYALYNIKAIKTNLAPAMQTSILFPVLVEVGEIIMHVDPTDLSNDFNKSIVSGVQKAGNQAQVIIETKAKALAEEVTDNLPQHKEE